MGKFKYIWIAVLALYFSFVTKTFAQQTVFNVPNADVTEKGHLFLQQEAQFRPWNNGAFGTGTSYGAYGIGHNTELDVTLFNVSAPAGHNVTLGTGFKTVVPIPGLKDKYPQREYKFTFGDEVVTSMQGQGAGNWSYAHFSGRTPVTNTRLTGGISVCPKQVFGKDTACFIGAVEQPVTKKLNIISDWYSGSEHFAGFLITGFSYAFSNNKTLYMGYQIPNSSKNGKSGFVLEFSKIF
jgi:hypothetical protein